MGADGHLNFDTKIDASGFNSGVKKLGSIAKTGMAAVTGAFLAATAVIAKSSLESVARLEQNLGGVETLFKDSADAVIYNANRAYKTAGMSANEYMSTVTSFSASLLQSLGNDTKKAVKYADMAIIDMSDNANKMGTSIELIQNAYQGFAKQNYTMLDNLKLGYGGTKSEMERLLQKAEEIKAKQGEITEYSIDSYADIVEAIHVVQEEMGITGTTAKEAMETIEGSTNAAKAAWDNFLNGSGTAEEFADAFVIAAENIIMALGEIALRLGETMPDAVSAIIENLSESIEEKEPEIMETGAQIITDFLMGMAEQLPQVQIQGMEVITEWLISIQEHLPEVTAVGIEIINTLLNSLVASAPLILKQGATMLLEFVKTIMSLLANVTHAGLEIITNLLSGILSRAGEVPMEAATMVANFIVEIVDSFGDMLQAGADIVANIISGIESKVEEVINQATSMVADFIAEFENTDWISIGSNIISGIASGVLGAAGQLVDAAVSAVSNAWDSMTSFLDMHSPSKKARDFIGKNWIKGIGIGFEDETPNLEKIGEDSMAKVLEAMESVSCAALRYGSVTRNTTDGIVKAATGNFTGAGLDYKMMKKVYKQAINEANARPVVLDGRELARI